MKRPEKFGTGGINYNPKIDRIGGTITVKAKGKGSEFSYSLSKR
jgi:hypothetical protein